MLKGFSELETRSCHSSEIGLPFDCASSDVPKVRKEHLVAFDKFNAFSIWTESYGAFLKPPRTCWLKLRLPLKLRDCVVTLLPACWGCLADGKALRVDGR